MKTAEPLRPLELRADETSIRTATRRRAPLKIADAYLLRHIVGATLRGLLWFAGLLLMATVIAAARRVVDGSLGLPGVWDLVSTDIPRVLLFTLPMSVLFGAVQTFADLSAKGEATALQIGGMSVGRMMRAPLLWGALVGLFVFVLQERFVPQTQQKKQHILALSALKYAPPREDFRLNDPFDGQGALKSIIQAKILDIKNGEMTQPVVQFYGSNRHLYKQITAPRGVWNASRRKWILKNAVVTLIGKSGNATVTPRDIEYSMPSPGELAQKSLTLEQHLNRGDFEMASISDLRDHRARLQNRFDAQNSDEQAGTQKLIRSLTYGIHDKIATPFVCLFFVLIGAPLALRLQRSGGGFSMGISLAVLLGYNLFWSWVWAVGRSGEVNPILFGYLPLAATALTGIVFFWRKAR